MLRRIYNWCIDAADKPTRSGFWQPSRSLKARSFPVPPRYHAAAMSLAQPKRAWWLATICTIASVAGGVLGYAIGALLYDSLGHWLITLYGLSDKVDAFRASYAEWGAVSHPGQGIDADPL